MFRKRDCKINPITMMAMCQVIFYIFTLIIIAKPCMISKSYFFDIFATSRNKIFNFMTCPKIIVIQTIVFYYSVIRIITCVFEKKLYFFQRWALNKKYDWNSRVVSTIQTFIALTYAYLIISRNELADNRIYGYSKFVSQVHSQVIGYFVWDLVHSYRYETFAFVLHAFISAVVFSMSLIPLNQYWGARFLLFDISNIPLNVTYLLNMINRTQSVFFKFSAIVLLISYFAVRCVYGVYISSRFIVDMIQDDTCCNRYVIPKIIFAISNICLIILNFIWMKKLATMFITKHYKPTRKMVAKSTNNADSSENTSNENCPCQNSKSKNADSNTCSSNTRCTTNSSCSRS